MSLLALHDRQPAHAINLQIYFNSGTIDPPDEEARAMEFVVDQRAVRDVVATE